MVPWFEENGRQFVFHWSLRVVSKGEVNIMDISEDKY